MSLKKTLLTYTVAALAAAPASFMALSAQADEAGAFIGGIAAARIGSSMRARTQAEQQQAYYAQQQAQQAAAQPVQQAPAAPAQKTTQQKLDELDSLAAGGYITPDEYKAKKQQILDSM
jgi:hypothetical protein